MELFEVPDNRAIIYTGRERDQLDSWLTSYRETLLVKCNGLTTEQMKRRPVETSSLSLLGIIRHMTFVEQVWFERIFAGKDVIEYYKQADDRDADFNNLDELTVLEVVANYEHAIEVSHEIAQGQDLSTTSTLEWRHRYVDLRWIFLHMIEEYARHCGHADLIRELIDGVTGQ
ncbi:MAG: DinB family protein [Acidimicrobiales bacterium]